MYWFNHTFTAVLTLSFGLLAACEDRRTPVEPNLEQPPSGAEAAISHSSTLERAHEAEFHRLSKEIEGYGGHFLDEQGNLVVYLVHAAQESRARQLLAPVLNARPLSARKAFLASQGSVIVRKANFTFPQLARWRDLVTHQVLGKEGVVFTDLDETRNRVVIGVSTLRGRMEAAQVLRTYAIPPQAIAYVEATPVVPELTLQERFHPLRGGFKIASAVRDCTLGFNAIRDGEDVFLTASHCSSHFWWPDDTRFYQPTNGSGLVGREIHDPAGTSCGATQCRWSDAAVVRRDVDVSGDFGYIARTSGWATGLGSSGSITVDPNNPRMKITSEYAFPVVNDELDKIGQATGWTFGTVHATCVDIFTHRPQLGRAWCQDLTRDMHTAPGDSGSPMFVWEDSTVRLAGLHRGRMTYEGTDVAIMSAMWNIRADLGDFSTF